LLNEKSSSIIPVATVTECLVDDHIRCNGSYIDVTHTFAIKCICKCHSYSFNDRSITGTGTNCGVLTLDQARRIEWK
jgi:hypothetical protein